MSTNKIPLEAVLSPDEYAKLDSFGGKHAGAESLPALAEFLKQEFGVELSLDPDIVVGFAVDSSNLPGHADAVCRPQSDRECAIFARAFMAAGIPYTLSAGKSNLTGSATPEGGVVMSTERMTTPEVRVDETAKTVRAPVGIILEQLRNEVLSQTNRRLHFPVDPTSRTDAFVGGALACNASGFIPGEIGAIRHWVEKIDFMFPNGLKVTAKRGQYVSEGGEFVLAVPSGGSDGPTPPACLPAPSVPDGGQAGGGYPSQEGRMAVGTDNARPEDPLPGRVPERSEGGVGSQKDQTAQIHLPVPRHARVAIKNAGGPYSSPDGVMDLVDLIVGSEGLFGFITACTLKLAERPDDYLDLFFSLPSEEKAFDFRDYLAATLEGGLESLSALEYFGLFCRKYMDHEDQLFLGDSPVGMYVQVPLYGKEIEDAAEEWLEILMSADCDIDDDGIILMDSDRQRAIFLESRHSLPGNYLEVAKQRGTFTIMTDALVPPDRFREFMAYAHSLLQSDQMDYLEFGHVGDCHIHFGVLPTRDQLDRGAEIYDMIVAKAAELGGVYSGEHGTGKRKRNDFLMCHGEAGVEEVRTTKAAVDPDFLVNRGDVIEYSHSVD